MLTVGTTQWTPVYIHYIKSLVHDSLCRQGSYATSDILDALSYYQDLLPSLTLQVTLPQL